MQGDKIMSTEEKTIHVRNEGTVIPNSLFTIHIRYDETLTLKELSEALELINKAINDINRQSGINNSKLGREYAAKVDGVSSGSIVVNILAHLVQPVALSMLASFIYDRLKSIGAKKRKNLINEDVGYPISMSVYGNNNLIEINIKNSNNN